MPDPCKSEVRKRGVGGRLRGSNIPKGPLRTKNTTTIAKIVNYYAVVFLLRPPDLLRRGPFSERENVCNSQENGVRTRSAAIVNHSAVVKILRVVNLLRVVFLVRRGPLGSSGKEKSTKTFLGPETAGWGGGLHAKGWGSKSSCLPSKVCLPEISREGSWDVPGILPGCPGALGVFKKFV